MKLSGILVICLVVSVSAYFLPQHSLCPMQVEDCSPGHSEIHAVNEEAIVLQTYRHWFRRESSYLRHVSCVFYESPVMPVLVAPPNNSA